MKKVFLDTNIVIDYLAKREPFAEKAFQIFVGREYLNIELCISALSFTTIFYILKKQCARVQLRNLLKAISTMVTILPVSEQVIHKAINSDFHDFEDAVQYYTALEMGMDVIITRNTKDYLLSQIEVFTPEQFIK